MKILKYILGIGILSPIPAYSQVPVDFSQNINKYYNQSNGVAPLDSNKMMSAPVSGDSSASPISKIVAPGDATYPTVSTRNIGEHFSDIPTLRDFGMRLAPNQNDSDTKWVQNNWSSLTSAAPVIIPSGAHWPDNRYVPDSNAINKTAFTQFPIVTALGSVASRPGYNTQWAYGVPYYGDVVPSLTHDDASFEFARVDSNEATAGLDVPLVQIDSVIDTNGEENNTGNQSSLMVRATTTPKAKGTFDNLNTTMISQGYNYWGGMNVNKWSHTRNNGTNWVWDNIQELFDESPFYCDSTDNTLCSAEYMNEEDMYGIGPEHSETSFDPTESGRIMFWLTTNHNINNKDTPTVRWSANLLVPAHKIITAVDASTNKEYMYEGVHTGYVRSNTFRITGTISGNTLTATNVSGGKITPGSTYIFDGTVNDEVIISSQTSGTSGDAGVYTIASKLNPNGFTVSKSTTFSGASTSSARFSVTGKVKPNWTFKTGDTFVDGTTTWKCIGPWQYDIGSILRIGGSNSPSTGYIERIGTLMSEETDYIYNSIFDMSKAAFDPSVPYNVFARLQKNMWMDFTADGTQSGQNNHLLGYIDGYADSHGPHTGEFKYMVSKNASAIGKAFTGMELGDDGTVDFPGLGTSHKSSGSHFLCIDDNGGIFKSDTACVSH